MGGLSVIVGVIVLIFIPCTACVGVILLIISAVLFVLHRKAVAAGRASRKNIGGIVTCIVGGANMLPLIIITVLISINNISQNIQYNQELNAIQNKAYATGDDWKDGFTFDGKQLVPVHLLINHSSYSTDARSEVGALVINGTNSYFNIYTIENDSGFTIYRVWVSSFRGGEHYTCTFVAEEDYDEVIDYYRNAPLDVYLIERQTTDDSDGDFPFSKLSLDLTGRQEDIMDATMEILDNHPDIATAPNSINGRGAFTKLEFCSSDDVLTIEIICIETEGNIEFWIEGFPLEGEASESYEQVLTDLMTEVKSELRKMI